MNRGAATNDHVVANRGPGLNLDVVANMFLGRETVDRPVALRRLAELDMERRALDVLRRLNVTTIRSVRSPVATLSGGQRQSVAISRAVMWNSKIVLLDEPTAALGVAQTHQVRELIKRLRTQGLGVVLISHNLNDVFSVADRMAVLYLGNVASEGPITDYDTQSAVELITTGATSRSHAPANALSSEPEV